jgi:hypothetical protein
MMRGISLPLELQDEVLTYLLHVETIPDMQHDMGAFMKMLSPALKSQVLFFIHKNTIR